MDELTLDGNIFVSTKRAAKITGYAKDYIGQLCREGRVAARLVGRNWYVLESSIRAHRFGEEAKETEETTITSQISENESSETVKEATNPELETSEWQPSRYITEEAPEPLFTASEIVSSDETKDGIVEILAPTAPTALAAPIEQMVQTDSVVPINQEINLVEGRFPVKESVPLSSKIVNDMQEAWQDWFIRTNDFKTSKETLLQDHYGEMEPLLTESITSLPPATATIPVPDTIDQERNQESEVIPIKLEKIIDHEPKSEPVTASRTQIDTGSEAVSIRRSKTAPMPVRSHIYASSDQISRYTEAKEGRVLRESRILRKRKPSNVIQAFLVLIALSSIAVAFIGSSLGESYLSTKVVSFKPVQFVIGERSINK